MYSKFVCIVFILLFLLLIKKMTNTLSNKTNYSILKISGFRTRMKTLNGKKIIQNRRRKGRSNLVTQKGG